MDQNGINIIYLKPINYCYFFSRENADWIHFTIVCALWKIKNYQTTRTNDTSLYM
jgi:hypothetical protein